MERTATIVRSNEMLSQPVDGDLVILNMEHNNYIALDDIGRRIWDLLENPRGAGELCILLTKEFDGDPAQIASETLAFLDELLSEGLVRIADGRNL